MRFEHKARLPVANRGVKTRILVPVSWSHMTCIARIGRADVKRRFTNEYGPKRRAAGSSRPGESGCLHNRSASRPVPRRTGKQTIAQNQMKKSVFFKSSWTLPKLARSPDERLLPVCTTSLSRPLRGSLRRDRARFQRPHRGIQSRIRRSRTHEPDPDRLRRCRARVQCVSNSSACAGSPSLLRMTRLLNYGGPREGASVGGSVGSPSHSNSTPSGITKRVARCRRRS